MLVLVGSREEVIGSAFALWRPFVEACFRGLFVGFIASKEQVLCVTQDKEPYPKPFGKFASRLDTTFQTDSLFGKYAGRSWTGLNGFTHGGIEQLDRRMSVDGIIGEHFDSEEIRELIVSSAPLLTDAAIRFLEAIGREHAAQSLIERYGELYPPIATGR